jgi:hypothetical protein
MSACEQILESMDALAGAFLALPQADQAFVREQVVQEAEDRCAKAGWFFLDIE